MADLRFSRVALHGLALLALAAPLRAAPDVEAEAKAGARTESGAAAEDKAGGEPEAEFDPSRISEVDAIACKLAAPDYNGFALSVSGDDGIALQRRWRRIETDNPFLNVYELPAPITVAGHSTRRIAFSSSAIMAVLDLADPTVVAAPEGVTNAADAAPLIAALVAAGKANRAEIEAAIPFRKFLGEKVLSDVTEPPAAGESFGAHTVIARTISNVSTLPGQTLYGCSYRITLIGRDGKPL